VSEIYSVVTSHTESILILQRLPRPHRVIAPASTPMMAQAPELPAGREPMSQRWCYFCGRRGQPTKRQLSQHAVVVCILQL
jgi:hypothetical protein